MKKVFSLLAILAMGMLFFSSCSSDDTTTPPESPVNLNSLAGKIWTLYEGNLTTTFNFLNDKDMTVTEVTGPASVKMTRAGETRTYNGTYSYNNDAKTAEFNYNNRTRKLTDIEIGARGVNCKIDGVQANFTVPDEDKKFLDETAREFVGLFNSGQTANYASIYNALKDTKASEGTDNELDDIVNSLKELVSSQPDLTIYRYAIKATAFKGHYVLREGLWYKESGNGFSAQFYDDQHRSCELNVTLSGTTKNVILYEDDNTRYKYDQNWQIIGYEEERKIYEGELPPHIECILTQGGSQLVKIVADIDLNSLTENQKVNISRNSLSLTCTADLRDVAKINVTKASYQAQGKSEINVIVEKNNRNILSANATTDSNLTTSAPEEWKDKDAQNIKNTTLNLNILDKVQVKSRCSNIYSLVKTLDNADSYDYRYNEQAVRQYVNQANSYLNEASLCYNNTSDVRATVKFDVDYKESSRWDSNTSSYIPTNKYFPVASIVFPDGSSYFMGDYFTEDYFRVLIDMVEDLGEKVEDQFDPKI